MDEHKRRDFQELLRGLRMSQKEFRTVVGKLSGDKPTATTTSRWVRGSRKPPPCAIALLVMIGRLTPEELNRIL